MIKKEILQDLDGDDLTPPQYWIMTRLPPSAPPGPEAALMPDPGPGEVPAAATPITSSSPGVRRAAVLVDSDPGDRSLWPTLPGSGSSRTAQAIPTSPGEY